MEHIITVGEELRKRFHENGFAFLSSVPQRRIQEMILAMAQKGHGGKMTDCRGRAAQEQFPIHLVRCKIRKTAGIP